MGCPGLGLGVISGSSCKAWRLTLEVVGLEALGIRPELLSLELLGLGAGGGGGGASREDLDDRGGIAELLALRMGERG